MLRIENLTYRVGGRVLLDGASATVAAGRRVGLVGRNGCGKTTLLKLVTGALEADGGTIEINAGARVGLTRQDAPGGEISALEATLAADDEIARLEAEARTATDPHRIAEIHERLAVRDAHAAPARAARILSGLGFSEADQARPCGSFAGGWRMRIALAGLLFSAPDLMLLDEPTNHLDLEASLWLEDYLRDCGSAVVLVSHDRGLLNRSVDEILHLDQGKLTLYAGGYDRFEDVRRARAEQVEKARVKQGAERARIQAFVDRFRYKASKARQAQSRLKLLEKMKPIADAPGEHAIRFDFPEPEGLPPPLVTLDEVSVGYDGLAVLRRLDLRIDAEDRIALLGANGNGKSTFVKLLAGRIQPLAGRIVKSGKLRIGYFAQHQAEELDLAATPLVEMARKRPGEPEERIRSHLGRFGFGGPRAETRVGSLSGGEKARLLFALMTSHRPHILLLDEPTNHLDLVSRQALIEAVNAYPGAVVLVSHDHHVLELIADRLWLVDGGAVTPFEGDIEDYRARVAAAAGGAPGRASGTAANRKAQRRAAAERQAQLAPLRSRLAAAERAVADLVEERAQITAAMADAGLWAGDPARSVALNQRLSRIEKSLAAAEEAWFALQESWDAQNAPTAPS